MPAVAGEPADRHDAEAVICRRAFGLVYQPVLDLATGAVLGVEALCRLDDARPTRAWFEQCAAEGLAPAMDLAVLELLARDVDRLPSGYVAVNLAPASLHELGALEADLIALARRHTVVIELTERAAIAHHEAAAANLAWLRAAGVLLALDGVGAGPVRLLEALRPEIIKLDRSITSSLATDPAKRAMTAAIGVFAAATGADVVAVGVESRGELAAVQAAGVGAGQGFGLAMPSAPPVPAPVFRPRLSLDLRRPAVLHPASVSEAGSRRS